MPAMCFIRLVILLTAACLLPAKGEDVSGISAERAVALAERFVVDKGLMIAPVNAKRGDLEHLFYQGKIESEAWGYQRLQEGTEYERWRVLFPIKVTPLPQVKGNETAWGMLVEISRTGDKVFVSHGVAAAYDGKPFEGFTRIEGR